MGKPQSNFQYRTIFGVPLIAGNVSAMSSGGFETQNFKYRMNYDSRTNVEERTNTAIAYSRR